MEGGERGQHGNAALQAGTACQADIVRFHPVGKAVLDQQAHRVPGAPQHEVPGHAVPQADQHHGTELGDQQHFKRRKTSGAGIARGLFGGAQRTGKRVKPVGAEPHGEGYMPVIPELGQIGLEIGIIEIFRQGDPHQVPQSDRQIGITAEIEINLQGIGVNQQPGPAGALHLRRVRGVERKEGQAVGHDKLLKQPQRQALPGQADLRRVAKDDRLAQIFDEAFAAVDRAGGKGRIEKQVGHIFAKTGCRQTPVLAVAQGVEDAKGQVRETQPAQVSRGGARRALVDQRAQDPTGGGGQRRQFKHHQQGNQQADPHPQCARREAQPSQTGRQQGCQGRSIGSPGALLGWGGRHPAQRAQAEGGYRQPKVQVAHR